MIAAESIWPEGARGAVSLTFDDGLRSQLERAIPALERSGLRGTFYLCARKEIVPKLGAWTVVARSGHELGNHTAHHPCPENVLDAPHPSIRAHEEMSPEEYEADLLETSRALAELAPAQKDCSFAYPCYQTFVGRGEGRRSIVSVVARHCIAGRGQGEIPFANDPLRADLAHLWSWPCERRMGAELIGLVEHAVAGGRWAILTFHGIHEGHLSVAEVDFVELCEHLAREKERIWTAPIASVAKYLKEARGKA